jgi:hypothetical protein
MTLWDSHHFLKSGNWHRPFEAGNLRQFARMTAHFFLHQKMAYAHGIFDGPCARDPMQGPAAITHASWGQNIL